MRLTSLNVVAVVLCIWMTESAAQRMQQREQQFLKAAPRVGEPVPDVTVYLPDGEPFQTANLRGHYTVLTFGCLT